MLRQLEAEGRWAQWRTLASLALLYHHGGVLVPPARYRPLRSLDCFWGGGGARAGGPLLDLQAMFPGLVEEVDGGHGAAWGPDLRLVAAPRHDEAMRRAVARLFFSDEGEKEEEEQLTARVLMLLRDGGDVR